MKKVKRYFPLNELKVRARDMNKTYRSLSKETGLSVDAINNKFNGYSAIDSDDVELFSKALKIEPSDIPKYFFPRILRNVANERDIA